jgi:hypothetical protein
MSFQLDLAKGTVKRDIAEIPNKMLEGAFEAINEVADLMVGFAQIYVRVDTGSLRDSIRKERVAPAFHNHRMVRVRAGGYVTNPRTGRLVDYAVVVEQKYPYMKPAWHQVKGQVADIIRRKCLEHIREVASVGVLRFPQ